METKKQGQAHLARKSGNPLPWISGFQGSKPSSEFDFKNLTLQFYKTWKIPMKHPKKIGAVKFHSLAKNCVSLIISDENSGFGLGLSLAGGVTSSCFQRAWRRSVWAPVKLSTFGGLGPMTGCPSMSAFFLTRASSSGVRSLGESTNKMLEMSLMVQKSHSQPPGMYKTPCKEWEICHINW